jgi:hypothetical protein
MKYFKNSKNEVYAYAADGSEDGFIAVGLVSITQVQADALRMPAPSAQPDGQGFLQAIKIGLGGIVAVNTLLIAYPAFLSAIQLSEWLDVQSLLIDALSKTAITPIQYAAIKSAAATYNIPVTL